MGNQSSKEPSHNVKIFKILMDLLQSESPTVESIRFIHQSYKDLKLYFPNQKLPKTFAADFGHLCEIHRFLSKFEDIEGISDADCNLLTALAVDLAKPDSLMNILVNLAVERVRDDFSKDTKDAQACCNLFSILLKVLKGVIFATGGDPATFPNASNLAHRIHLMHCLLNNTINELLPLFDTNDSQLRGGVNSHITEIKIEGQRNETAEAILVRVVFNTAEFLANNQLYNSSRMICKVLIHFIRNCSISFMQNIMPLVYLLITRCLIGLNEIDDAIPYAYNFVQGAGEECLLVLTKEEGHLSLNKTHSSPSMECAFNVLLSFTEVSFSAEARWKICYALLPSLASKHVNAIDESSAQIDNKLLQLQEKVICVGFEAFMELNLLIDAYNWTIQCPSEALKMQFLPLIVYRILELSLLDELISLNWEKYEFIVEKILLEKIFEECCDKSDWFDLLYKWHLSRGSVKGAAACMYTRHLSDNDYYSLQLCYNALMTIDEEGDRWFHKIDEKVELESEKSDVLVHVNMIRREMILTGAENLIGIKAISPKRNRLLQLVIQLLKAGELGTCLTLIIEDFIEEETFTRQRSFDSLFDNQILNSDSSIPVHQQTPDDIIHQQDATTTNVGGIQQKIVDLVIGFLIDSMAMVHEDKSWLPSIFRLGILSLEECDEDPIEYAILRYLVSNLPNEELKRHGILYMIEQLSKYQVIVPEWLVKLAVIHEDPNRVFQILGMNNDLAMIAKLLKDVKIRSAITPGTIAYLNLLTKDDGY